MNKIITAIAVLAAIAAGTAAAVIQQLKGEEYASVDEAIKANLPEGCDVCQRFSAEEDTIVVLNHPQQNVYGFMEIYRKKENYVLHGLALSYKSNTEMIASFCKKKEWNVKIHLTPKEDGSMDCWMETLPLPQKNKKK